MTEWLLVLTGVGLTIGTAIFVATEFSLVALDRPTVQRAIDSGDPRAEVVLQPLDLSAQRRLRDQQLLGRPPEVPVLGDHREVPHEPQVEVHVSESTCGDAYFALPPAERDLDLRRYPGARLWGWIPELRSCWRCECS